MNASVESDVLPFGFIDLLPILAPSPICTLAHTLLLYTVVALSSMVELFSLSTRLLLIIGRDRLSN